MNEVLDVVMPAPVRKTLEDAIGTSANRHDFPPRPQVEEFEEAMNDKKPSFPEAGIEDKKPRRSA